MRWLEHHTIHWSKWWFTWSLYYGNPMVSDFH